MSKDPFPAAPAGHSAALRAPLLRVAVACLALLAPQSPAGAQPARPTVRLSIVVIAGEDAVNIIQQKTAVAPVVEVRDRNDQPVAGAVVRFAIRGGRASFSGARTMTVTTGASGRAAVAGLTPTTTGSFQIGATATYQGQTAAVSIAQVNVMTAAQAAGAAAAGGSVAAGAGAAVAGAGAGGGIGAATIGALGAAAAGGTLAAIKVAGASGASSDGPRTLTGPISVPVGFTIERLPGNPDGVGLCTDDRVMSGSMSLTLDDPGANPVTGVARASYIQTVTGGSCSRSGSGSASFDLGSVPVSGSPGALSFELNLTRTVNGGTVFDIYTVTGAVANSIFTGTVAYRGGFDSPVQRNRGAVTFPVNLQ